MSHATHGFIKKGDKVPESEIDRAVRVREQYFKSKTNKKSIMAKKMKTRTLAEMKDKYIGKVGSQARDEYEYELRMDVLGKMIKAARQERNLTQEELGKLIGVQ